MSRVGSLRRRVRRSRHRRLLRRARPRRRRARRRCRRGSRRCGAARCRSTSPASTSCSRATRSGSRYTPRRRRGGARRRLPLRRRRHAADLLRRRRPLALSGRWSTSCRELEQPAVVVMKSTVPVGTGARSGTGSTSAGLAHVGYVSNPEFTAEGTAIHDFHAARPDRDRRVRGRDGDAVAALHAGIDGADRPLRRRLRGDDQARGERSADDADQLHQRDRERLRGDRRGRRARRRGHRPRPPHRPELPARRDRLRRLVLSEGLAGAEAARGELRLPLPAPERGDRGQRAPEAPRDRQAEAPPRQSAREVGRAARARVQAEHRRHA